MSKNKQKKIYRYQKFNAQTIELLVRDRLHFADPSSFNDPFDCQPVVELDSDREELRLILSALISRRIEAELKNSLKAAQAQSPKASDHAQRVGKQTAKSKLQDLAYHATNPEYGGDIYESERQLLRLEIQKELLRRYDKCVCCFSSTFSNLLLWSHYGDQHKGLCIGYNLDRNPEPRLRKVEYGGNRKIKTSLISEAILKNDTRAQELINHHVLQKKAPMCRLPE